MNKNRHLFFFYPSAAFVYLLVFAASPALATQTHGDPEGLYVHQLSHAFFLFSMGLLVYWIRTRGLGANPGWRYIQYAAMLFMVWTVDAFFAHFMDEHFALVHVTRVDAWHIRIESESTGKAILYYLLKLDHLWCVPALMFMYAGLRRLDRESRQNPAPEPLNSAEVGK